MADGVNKKSY